MVTGLINQVMFLITFVLDFCAWTRGRSRPTDDSFRESFSWMVSFISFHQSALVSFLCAFGAEQIEGALGRASWLIAGSSTPSVSQARSLANVPKLKRLQLNFKISSCKLWRNKF